MSTQKKPEETTTNQRWMLRLQRLPIIQQYKVSTVIAFIGLVMCNKGNTISLEHGMKIVKKSKLHLKIESNSAIPCVNILQALISLVIYKRELLKYFFDNQDLPIWSDETIAPLFDIMYEISKVYKI